MKGLRLVFAALCIGVSPAPVWAGVIVVGSGAGAPGQVAVFDSATLAQQASFLAFGPSYTGGVDVAIDDGLIVAGTLSGNQVNVYDATTLALRASFLAFDSSFTGGVHVSVGDDLIAVAVASGGSPHIKVFDATTLALVASFFAFDPSFTGGVDVSIDDGRIVAGAGPGGQSHVKVFDAATLALLSSFFAFSPQFTGGVSVSYDDGILAVGAATLANQLSLYDPATLVLLPNGQGTALNSILAFPGTFTGGIDVAIGGGTVLAGAGPGGAPHVNVYNQQSLALLNSFFAFNPTFNGGVRLDIDDAPAVPEPTSLLLLGTGIAGVAARVRQRRKQAK